MASTVAEPVSAAPAGSSPRRRGRIVALVVVVALVVGLAAAIAYRQTVRAEREALFYSALQSQSLTSLETMSQVGYGQIPVDSPALSDLFELKLYGEYQRSSVIVTPGQWRLQEGGTSYLLLEATGTNADLPAWVGDVSFYESVLLFGTFTDDENGVSSDVGSCSVRHGSPGAPPAVGTVQLTDTLFAEACTQQQLAAAGIA